MSSQVSSQLADSGSVAAAALPLVVVCVLNYRTAERTLGVVRNVLECDYPNLHLLLIENGSGDGSVEVLRSYTAPRLELLVSSWNRGFSGGCNLAFARAAELGAKYVWLLNSDAGAPPDALRKLVEAAETDETIGLVTPLIASDEDPSAISYAGAWMDVYGNLEESTVDVELGQRWMRERPMQFMVWGTALLVRTEMMQRIGGLDEHLFMYFEDFDLSHRTAVAGYRKIVVPDVVVLHDVKDFCGHLSNVRPHQLYYLFRNFILLRRKYGGMVRRARPIWWKVVRGLKLRDTLAPDMARGDAILLGLWHGFLGRGGPIPQRIQVPRAVRFVLCEISRRTKPLRPHVAKADPPSSAVS